MMEKTMTMKELLASIDAKYEKQEASQICEAPTIEELTQEVEIKKDEKKEEKPKIYIPNFAFPFKRISNHDKEKTTYNLMMENLFRDKKTQYLFNSSGLFHGGVHLNGAKFCGNTFETDVIRAIADGKVIAYRINKKPLENELNDETVRYTTGFFLLEHYMEYPVENKLKFYSLYMHMASMDYYENDFKEYILHGHNEQLRYYDEKTKKVDMTKGVPDVYGKKVTLTGEKIGSRYVVETLDDETPLKKLLVHPNNLALEEELHTTTTSGTGINLRYFKEKHKNPSGKIAKVLKAGTSITVYPKVYGKTKRYEVVKINGEFVIGMKETKTKEDKDEKTIKDIITIDDSNMKQKPKKSKALKIEQESFGLVTKKMKTNKVVELEDKEQMKVKAGDVLGKLGLYSDEWIEEPVVHLEIFTFDDVKKFKKDATEAYEKVDKERAKEEKEKEEIKEKKYVVGNLKHYTYLHNGLKKKKAEKGAKLTIVENKTDNRVRVLSMNGEVFPENEIWKISKSYVVDENASKKDSKSSKAKEESKKEERPKPNILYLPKDTTELYEQGEADAFHAKVAHVKKDTNIREGMGTKGELYNKKATPLGTKLIIGVKNKTEKDAKGVMQARIEVLGIAGEVLKKSYSVDIRFIEIAEALFSAKKSKQRLKAPVIRPIKNLKIVKDKEGIEYIEVAKYPSLYVKKYKDKKQTESWFTHGVTLKMFEVMEKEGEENIGIFKDTVKFYDKRESNTLTQEEKETLNPLFNEILGKLRIDKEKNGRLQAGELAGLTLSQEKQKELSYMVAKHESEWENPTRFEKLATFMDEMKATEYAEMMRNRTKELSFFDDVMAMDFSPTFFHPIALVGVMSRDCNMNIKLARVKAFLQMLRHGEGTVGDKGYETLYGGKSFIKGYNKDWSTHPSIVITKGKYSSSAAGAYQILDNYKNSTDEGTWEFLVRKSESLNLNTKINLNDFSPSSQDLYAVILLKYKGKRARKAWNLLLEGNIKQAIHDAYSYEWASLPTDGEVCQKYKCLKKNDKGQCIEKECIKKGIGRYGQPKKPMETDLKLFEKYYKDELVGKTTLKASNADLWFVINGTKYEDECNEIEEIEKVKENEDMIDDTKVILKIKRIKEWAKNPNGQNKNIREGGTISKYSLSIDGVEKATGYMLEAAGPDSKIKDTDYRIYEGEYSLAKNLGRKGDFTLVQLTKEMAKKYFGNRGKVNIHIGNYPKDVEGCLMPGKHYTSENGYPKVISSAEKYYELKKLIINNSKLEYKKSFDTQRPYKQLYSDVKVIIKNNF